MAKSLEFTRTRLFGLIEMIDDGFSKQHKPFLKIKIKNLSEEKYYYAGKHVNLTSLQSIHQS